MANTITKNQNEKGITIEHNKTLVNVWDAESPQVERKIANAIKKLLNEKFK